jgi:hypothetical protein
MQQGSVGRSGAKMPKTPHLRNMRFFGTGTLKSSTFRTNDEACGAGGGWGQGTVRARSAQCVLKPQRRFVDDMLPSEGSSPASTFDVG